MRKAFVLLLFTVSSFAGVKVYKVSERITSTGGALDQPPFISFICNPGRSTRTGVFDMKLTVDTTCDVEFDSETMATKAEVEDRVDQIATKVNDIVVLKKKEESKEIITEVLNSASFKAMIRNIIREELQNNK